jgi:6-pyruvoyl-tetrahydropterin synthase
MEPIENQERINNLIQNGVFKDIQEFTNKAVEKFLNDFDHSKVNPLEEQKSVMKIRVYAESIDELEDFLSSKGVNGVHNVTLVDYCKMLDGDFYMWHEDIGRLTKVFEVDLFEECPNFRDGEEATLVDCD